MRSILLALLICFALAGALAMGYIAADMMQTGRQVQSVIDDPIGALVRSVGLSATPEVRPDPVVIINDITRMAKLQTAEISMTRVYTASAGVSDFWGIFDDNLIFVAVGDVTAGVDLSKLGDNDIRVSSFETATVRLPVPEIFVAALNSEESSIIDRDTGILATSDPQLETRVRREATEDLRETAIEEGILDEATAGAEDTLRNLLTSFGFQNVVFIDPTDPLPGREPDPELPKGYIITPNP